MIIILFIVFLLLAFGIYMLLCSAMHLPSLGHTFSLLHVTQNTNSGKKEKAFDSFVLSLATRVSRFIHLNPDKRETMAAVLRSAGIEMAPETYYAKVIVRFLIKLIPAIIFCFLNPIAAAVFLFWAIWKLIDDLKEAKQRMNSKVQKIEAELPRFVSDISDELKTDRNVVRILSSYLPNAGKELKEELEITIADMKSGPQERALTRLETRVGSFQLSQVSRGLQAVLHGDDCTMYFQMLEYDFRNSGIQNLRMAAKKLPDKVRAPSVVVMVCAALTLFTVIIIDLFGKAAAFI